MRCVSMFNRWGRRASHTIMAMDGRFSAAQRLNSDVTFRTVSAPLRRFGFYPLQIRDAILASKPDLVVTYNWGAIESALGCTLGNGCPVVHMEHGFANDEARKRKLRRVIARRFVLNRVHATIVPSRELLRIALQEYRLAPAKVHYIPNGVDAARFRPGRDWQLRRKMGFSDEDVVFLYVGHLRPVKNLPLLLRAFSVARHKSAKLLIAGDGPCKAELEQLSGDLGICDSVQFSGFAEDPLPFYRAADAFVLSSNSEQMPMSLLEAMACGLPAVTTDVGDVNEILGCNSGNYVAAPHDVADYARGLRTVLAQDSDTRVATGDSNRRRCVGSYSFEKMHAAYSEIYWRAARRPELFDLSSAASLTQ